MGFRSLTVAIGFAFVLVQFSLTSTRPQQPLWNWEEVILSRNGPSTTTTPRPTRWTTTTLRFLGVETISGTGKGSFQPAVIVPRRKKANRLSEQGDGNGATEKNGMLLLTLMPLVASALLRTCLQF